MRVNFSKLLNQKGDNPTGIVAFLYFMMQVGNLLYGLLSLEKFTRMG
jgi:hypothetical protein